MAETVAQQSANPTRKLTAATVGAALISGTGLVLKNVAPEWYDPQFLLDMSPIVIFGLGWFVKDRPNLHISVEE